MIEYISYKLELKLLNNLIYPKRLQVEEICDKRLYIKRERERERERENPCVIYYKTKLWTQFYTSCLTWEQGRLKSVCASLQSDKTLLFCISSEMDVHT